MIEINTIWILLCGTLVIFMQAGFAMLETGSTRVKNKGNIVMKNIVDLCIGAPLFVVLGFGLMYGDGNGFIGNLDLLLQEDYSNFLPDGVSLYSFIFFQLAFCATAATIVSGSMSERTKFTSYCIFVATISVIIFPIVGHWVWGGGWLNNMGFYDFAGATVVHTVGGISAMVGAWIVGPRLGKYSKDGKAKAINGYSVTFSALGVLILWFGWYGFNGGSTLITEGFGNDIGLVFLNTTMSACVATVSAMLISKIFYKKADISLGINAALSGLVAITAGSNSVGVGSAAVIGMIAGTMLVISIAFIEKKLKIDDPVGAVSAHGVSGIIGTILVGVFSLEKGLIYTGNTNFLAVQVLGVFAVVAFTLITAFITFKLLEMTVGLRVEKNVEIDGLDMHEHGLMTVADDFTNEIEEMLKEEIDIPVNTTNIPPEIAVPVKIRESDGSQLTKIEIVLSPKKFNRLKQELNKIDITGMTVSKVLGCGIQKGETELYRGSPLEVKLLPKIKVEIVVAKVPVELVISTAQKALYTGHIGDGKIFVYGIDEAVKIRTGQRGFDAMQGLQD